jgi:arachidonate 15-lipoxygenase
MQRVPSSLRSTSWAGRLEQVKRAVVGDVPGRIPVDGDAEFAFHRFAGMNPVLIRRVSDLSQIPEPLRLPDERFSAVMGHPQRLLERLHSGHLYVLGYDALRAGDGHPLQPGKYVAPANVLFCFAPELDTPFAVVPVAIECATGRADAETTVVTPLDGSRWLSAKRLVGVADVNYAELCLHLARAHFMTVPFAMALHRVLPPSHALHQFLLPHLRFDLFVERMAWTQGVVNTGGTLVRSLAGSSQWSQAVARTVHRDLSFREQHFERDLAARDMNDAALDYPYRDDGRLLWQAIRAFVNRFIALTYPTEQALADDAPLHSFLSEVGSPQGGNVRGLLAGDRLTTHAELVEILTQVLFVAGPFHALCHYSSAAQLQHTDESPAFLIGNPLAGAVDSEPGAVRAMFQFTRVVSTYCRYDTLGDFSGYALGRRADCQDLIAAFQADLRQVEEQVQARNARRLAPFIHFLPSRISNGITV